MKKKLLAMLLSFTMLVGLLPMSVLAADGESEPTYVAQGAGIRYTSLEEAIEVAESADASFDQYGDLPDEATVILLADLAISETIQIESPVKIDLAGRTLTCSVKKAFEVYADAMFVGGTMDTESGVVQGKIVNTYADGRCIDTRTNVELKVQGIILETVSFLGNPEQ